MKYNFIRNSQYVDIYDMETGDCIVYFKVTKDIMSGINMRDKVGSWKNANAYDKSTNEVVDEPKYSEFKKGKYYIKQKPP